MSVIKTTITMVAVLWGLLFSTNSDAREQARANSAESFETDSSESSDFKLYRPTHDKFNLHLGVGFIYGNSDDLSNNKYEDLGVQGLVGFDVVLVKPLALSFQGGFNSLIAGSESESITSAFVGAGLRLRFFADTRGSLSEGGTAAGNMWFDAHFDYVNHIYEDHGGYDVGLGYEFALFKNINMGPYARFMHVAIGDGVNYISISGGLAISIAGDTEPGDMDLDSIIDDLDSCPKVPEDKDGFEDNDGCPDLDNDGDGIPDSEDKCPNIAGIAAKDGCPETDNDNDGIENQDDLCPDDAEDMDGFEDSDGCPDPDNDNDGVKDEDDQCPEKKEDRDGFKDDDGCPDLDNDGDGIPDSEDKCPNEAETFNGKEDEDGCPDLVRVRDDKIEILQKVYFRNNRSDIMEKSFELLDEVAAVIKAKPELKIRIEGHTDNVGKDRRNMKLSQARADSVMEYLMNAEIDENRLEAKGRGMHSPIADNKTKEGRQKNRRVEFHIVSDEKGGAKTEKENDGDRDKEKEEADKGSPKADGDKAEKPEPNKEEADKGSPKADGDKAEKPEPNNAENE